MEKKVYIVHCRGGSPNMYWYPWLKIELNKLGFDVEILEMPNTDEPEIKQRVGFLDQNVSNIDTNTYFVGHSIGCQTILRYLEKVENKTKIGGVAFVAGWFDLKSESLDPESQQIAYEWINTPIDFAKIMKHIDCPKISIFSDDDPYVSLDNEKIFREQLGFQTIVQSQKGHYEDAQHIDILLERFKNQK